MGQLPLLLRGEEARREWAPPDEDTDESPGCNAQWRFFNAAVKT